MADEGKPKTRQPRLSIREGYTESGVVAELLTLLETVTADGTISEEEARELNEWLEANRNDANLPGIEFLRITVTQILADGKVTPEEKTALYKAVERVLPREARRLAKERRGAVESLEKETQRAEREAQREAERREREGNRPMAAANFMVVGVPYEGRAEVVRCYASEGCQVFLARDPSNRYDSKAIEILLKGGYQIGFAPREEAAALAKFLDAGCKHLAYITKILQGKRAPIPVVQVYLYRPESSVEGAVSQSGVPAKRGAPEARWGRGCLSRAALVVGFLGLLILVAFFVVR